MGERHSELLLLSAVKLWIKGAQYSYYSSSSARSTPRFTYRLSWFALVTSSLRGSSFYNGSVGARAPDVYRFPFESGLSIRFNCCEIPALDIGT
ncbi:hypothetical protein BDZ89DRAFT_388875 [Hymenopellis radicata]|nr:hypothetical protein BDZ89DRAFT_388875 [Hymenopellis radicata]